MFILMKADSTCMFDGAKVVAVIPARGGSKGVPRKNIRMLAGKPTICYSIQHAKASKYIDRVVVSTEDAEIKKISLECGAEVVDRPPEYATDTAKAMDVYKHALEALGKEGFRPEVVVILQPTSPYRDPQDIDKMVELLGEKGCDSVISVGEVVHHPIWYYKVNGGGFLRPYHAEAALALNRQEADKLVRLNGSITVLKPEMITERGALISEKTMPYMMDEERSVDIDTPFDFWVMEKMIEKKENRPHNLG